VKRTTRFIAWVWTAIGAVGLVAGLVKLPVDLNYVVFLAGGCGLLLRRAWGWWVLTIMCVLYALSVVTGCILAALKVAGILRLPWTHGKPVEITLAILGSASLIMLLQDRPVRWDNSAQSPYWTMIHRRDG